MEKTLTVEEYERMQDEYNKVKYACSKCGHKNVIPKWMDKTICDWCGIWVFKNKKDEFKYRVKEKKMNKEELEEAFNETTDSAVDLLKENVELKKKYLIIKENAETLAKRIDKAVAYIKKEEWYLEEYDNNFINENVIKTTKLLEILKGDDKE